MAQVRVVIPTFNRAAVVVGAIESVLAQDYADLEVIVADDGSSDDTVERLRAAYAAEPRLRIMAYSHGGVAATRNAAIAEPGGHRYVAFLDSDDRWVPGHLRSAVAVLDAHPSVSLVFGAFEPEDATGTWSVRERGELLERIRRPASLRAGGQGPDGPLLDVERALSAFLQGTIHPKTSTVVVRVSSVHRHPWFDASMVIMEDSDFYLRLVTTRQPWAFLDAIQARVQFLGDNLTRAQDLASPVTLEKLQCDLRYAVTRLEFCTSGVERRVGRRTVADRAYLIGQSCAEQRLWARARRAYYQSLAARPTWVTLKSLTGTLLPDAVRRAIGARRRL